jgi:hypothetical protein
MSQDAGAFDGLIGGGSSTGRHAENATVESGSYFFFFFFPHLPPSPSPCSLSFFFSKQFM